jgi:quinol monooxygenase YgiN
MYLLEIDYRLNSDKRHEFESSLESLLDQEPRPVRTSIFEDRRDSNRLLLVWEWSDEQQVNRYLTSDTFGVFSGCLKTLGTIAETRVVNTQSSAAAAAAWTSVRMRRSSPGGWIKFTT